MPGRYGVGRSGRSVGLAVVSESVGAAEGSASASIGGMADSAGMSSALSSSRVVSANGPDPTGWRPNVWSASRFTGTSSRRWAGAIGWVAAWRNPPSGVLSVNVTTLGETARTRHLGPRRRAGARVVGILERLDREDDVVGRDRLAIVPAGVIAELERPDATLLVDGPALGEVGHDRAVRTVADETREDERHEVPVRLRPGGQAG